ncbi:enoyl-CoA hydratase/isomerase family protein [Rhodovulum sp. DZ06]|uniref:enoyl-CoA hydratase/isomerase family protein n=1 Tax=Rhodovulum sp. DZ06 TaxID=3425126 RepID=UPI003D34055C
MTIQTRGGDQLIVRKSGRAGRITMNNPKALNALTMEMSYGIEDALDAFRDDDGVDLVIIDAAGDRAFGAGGDVKELAIRGREGDVDFSRRFFGDEYLMNAALSGFAKPVVTMVDGIVMGGGVGVSGHGSHRIVSEKTVLAMPECGIGLIPDVGGTWLLSRGPGRVGEWLGLTGARIGAADAITAGFADVFVPSSEFPHLIEGLEATGDVSILEDAAQEPEPGEIPGLQAQIDRCFEGTDPEAIVARLQAEGEWGAKQAKAILRGCPLSVHCTLELLDRARKAGKIEDCLVQEYRFAARCIDEGEFLEGIRAQLIDKDRNPQWAAPNLGDVTSEKVASMLAPVPSGDWPDHLTQDA